MPELRWTLLLLGAVFVGVLAWWEWRKRGQASPGGGDHTTIQEPLPRVTREPILTLPDIRVREPAAPQELPVVAIETGAELEEREVEEDESLLGLRIDGRRLEDELAAEEEAARATQTATPQPPAFPTVAPEAGDDPPAGLAGSAGQAQPIQFDEPMLSAPMAAERLSDEPIHFEPMLPGTAPPTIEAAATGSRATVVVDPDLPRLSQAEPPLVDWPPEQDRRILAVRIISMSAERFPGRAVRTALVAEGFELGKYSIFHKPDAARRAVLSAASLSKPGVFDMDNIDSQRFGGLSLFAVLPGPRAAREVFEDLLSTARNLNERLQGGLQDEHGNPLTPSRVAALREGLGGEADMGPRAVR